MKVTTKKVLIFSLPVATLTTTLATTAGALVATSNKKNNDFSNSNNGGLNFNQELSQNIYDSIVSAVPSGKITLDDLNSTDNINNLKSKIATILNISTNDIEDIKFIDSGGINKANVKITFSSNIVFTLDENDPCFVQNGNVITSKNSFNYGSLPQVIPSCVEESFNNSINEYLNSKKESQSNSIRLDVINDVNNINTLIPKLNDILIQNNIESVKVTTILFIVNETNSGVYASISFDGLVKQNDSGKYIEGENLNTLISKDPFSITILNKNINDEFLLQLDMPTISKVLGTYGSNVPEVISALSKCNTLNEFVSNYFPVSNKEFKAQIMADPKNNDVVKFYIYFNNNDYKFIQVDIYPSFGNEIKGNFIIDGGVLVGLTDEGKQQETLDLTGLKIDSIGINALRESKMLKSIKISKEVKSIGINAFYLCPNLTTVTFEENSKLVKIDSNAFSGCKLLKSFNVPANVISIGNYAFTDCPNLFNVNIESNSELKTIGKSAFVNPIDIDLNNCPLINEDDFLTISINNPIPNFIKNNCEIDTNNALDLSTISSSDTNIYNSSTNTLTIPSNYKIIIGKVPSDIQSKVVNIEFQSNSQITTISSCAFEKCPNLVSVKIPASVVTIENNAFDSCMDLTTVTFEKNSELTTIGNATFHECRKLSNISFENNNKLITIGEGAFFNSSLTRIEIPSSVVEIGGAAFNYCYNLENVIFQPNSKLTKIAGSFTGCNKLKQIDLNNCEDLIISQFVDICNRNPNVEFLNNKFDTDVFNISFEGITNTTLTIPSQAKYIVGQAPKNITSVNFEENTYLKTIPNSSFSYCRDLIDVNNIPSSVVEIGINAFNGCNKLETITFESNSQLKSILERSFYDCSSLTKIVIPSSVNSIGEYAFCGCSQLNSITFEPNSQLKTIKKRAFEYCRLLNDVTLPNSVITLEDAVFASCDSLSEINLPENLISLGYGVFERCNSLISINIPASVETISQNAFINCSNLESVNFDLNSKLKFIDSYAFNQTKLTEINLNNCDNLTINQFVDICNNNKNINFVNTKFESQVFNMSNATLSNTTLVIPQDAKYLIGQAPKTITSVDFNGNTFINSIPSDAFNKCTSLTSIDIPDNVTTIGLRAFSECSSLESVNLPKNITKIDNWVFNYCSSLKNISIPNSVTSIGEGAFRSCAFESITIPNTIVSIGNRAFERCWLMSNVTFESDCQLTRISDGMFADCAALKTITIPEGIELIGASAFDDSGLTSINISSSVKTIDRFAFNECSELKTINFAQNSNLHMINSDAFKYTYIGTIDLTNCKKITLLQKNAIIENNKNVRFIFSN